MTELARLVNEYWKSALAEQRTRSFAAARTQRKERSMTTFPQLPTGAMFRIVYPDPNDPAVYRKTGPETFEDVTGREFMVNPEKANRIQVVQTERPTS